jgi:hypothetical protein
MTDLIEHESRTSKIKSFKLNQWLSLLGGIAALTVGIYLSFVAYSQSHPGEIDLSDTGSKTAAISSGKVVDFTFQIPKGYENAELYSYIDKDFSCGRATRIDIRAVRGQEKPFHISYPTTESIGHRLALPIKASMESITLSAVLSDPVKCPIDVTLRIFSVSSPSTAAPQPLTALAVALIVCGGIAAAVSGLAFASLWEEVDDDNESRARVREAEENFEASLRLHHPSISADDASRTSERNSLILSDLWQVTHRRLDRYHKIALTQAARSFRNAQIAMGVGFLLLIGFTLLAMTAKTTAASIVAGALGVTSAALSGYVSSTFVRSQESSAAHLRAYFDQPLEFSRYLAAERLVADAQLSNEERVQLLASVVQAMVQSSARSIPSVDTAGGPPQNT